MQHVLIQPYISRQEILSKNAYRSDEEEGDFVGDSPLVAGRAVLEPQVPVGNTAVTTYNCRRPGLPDWVPAGGRRLAQAIQAGRVELGALHGGSHSVVEVIIGGERGRSH